MNKSRKLLFALLPLVALAALVYGIVNFDTKGVLSDIPPVEQITFERTTLTPGEIRIDFINSGPDPVTIAQVMVDDAYWSHTMDPADRTLERLEHGTITIPYHWVDGETHAVRLISRNGVTFDTEIEVAIASPTRDAGSFWFFVLLGVLIGVVPVGLGLLFDSEGPVDNKFPFDERVVDDARLSLIDPWQFIEPGFSGID